VNVCATEPIRWAAVLQSIPWKLRLSAARRGPSRLMFRCFIIGRQRMSSLASAIVLRKRDLESAARPARAAPTYTWRPKRKMSQKYFGGNWIDLGFRQLPNFTDSPPDQTNNSLFSGSASQPSGLNRKRSIGVKRSSRSLRSCCHLSAKSTIVSK
jgi:hypothetical protein